MEKATISYQVYTAGGLFTQHELTTNVLIKEAVWQLSNGKFELILPQSKELRDLDRPDIAAYIRNTDLLQVVEADVILARFDGLELDAGTLVEYMLAKFLGKPAVIVRSDYRRLASDSFDEPYNLMAKNWPRTTVVHIDSIIQYIGVIQKEMSKNNDDSTFETVVKAELQTVRKGVQDLSRMIIDALEAAIALKSPYPEELREAVYKIARYSPGSGFAQLLSEEKLDAIIKNLKEKGTF